MRMLTAVLNDNNIQQYIYENENYAFDYLKENLAIEPIFNYVIENINNFINEDDLDYSYENIKAVSRNYVLGIINEANLTNMELNFGSGGQAGYGIIGNGASSFFNKLKDFGFNDDDAGIIKDIAVKLDLNSTESKNFITSIMNADYANAKSILRDNDVLSREMGVGKELLSRLQENSIIDKLGRFFNRLGRNDLSQSLNEVKEFALQNPAYSIPAVILGILGCIGMFIGGKKLINKTQNR